MSDSDLDLRLRASKLCGGGIQIEENEGRGMIFHQMSCVTDTRGALRYGAQHGSYVLEAMHTLPI